jgi:hypothetical protein
MQANMITPQAKASQPAEVYCQMGCKCPDCQGYLKIEWDTLAHFCPVCNDYKIPVPPCDYWDADRIFA